jgi:hypothetical protein
MSDKELTSWVGAQLHDVAGFSDKTVAQYIVAAAKRAKSDQQLISDMVDSEQLPNSAKT